ncbi:PRC-barrel domain-containing protein [Iningainema tapete]|uniref:PRC-barrel domain-containing protein n=1 Tax=Iningainema tapete BLCC-T55 TaxID=2748662 RepID=A0A8J6XP12_9CYAN|nr:PRC-barrel domain-containing protein [Iningainema tapete]MBD2773992.1 PRC-barrel domain-containing protein [Iningainema tapete BLCC-T55]
MALYKLDEYDPNYANDIFDGYDIKNFDVYADDDKVGSVTNVLVDENDGRFRYFIIDTGFWILGKKVLLPVGLARLNYDDKRLYVLGLTKEQVKNLPEFTENLALDNDYEERVRGVYRPLVGTTTLSQFSYNPGTYNYLQEPYFYDLGDRNLRTYEERLISRRNRIQKMR